MTDTAQAGSTPEPVAAMPLPTLRGLLGGLTYQTPVIGTIRIGSVEDRLGIKVPVPDDEFSVHARFRDDAGKWVEHAEHAKLKQKPEHLVNEKLRRIPVRLVYDSPNLNMGEQYAAFTSNGRPACVGNGCTARQITPTGVAEVACPGSDACVFGLADEHRCGTLTRAIFHLEGQAEADGVFIFRTGSYNSVNDMRFRLETLHAGFGKKLAGLPMWLTMRLKSTAQSSGHPFFYVSLEPRFASLKEASAALKERASAEDEAGFNRQAYEAAASLLLANGAIAEHSEDTGEFEELLVGRPGQTSQLPRRGQRQSVVGPDISNLVSTYAGASANEAAAVAHPPRPQAA
ncbi:MAG: hypothetical protein PSV26_02975 [Polaromonas sp.]|uniref:recombination directionality factor n=1 Tax=Polaromonas sp. TaxID=1869339 RepID=UPI002489BC27|nr:hypothetical protein [Polaromonas sp.]MDI1236429.1 hypothetical protein [Polaromonas sp.]